MTRPALDAAGGALHYAAERSRLLGALRHVTDYGLIEQIAHVGPTSVPGLPPAPVVELAVTMWPFPLTDSVLGQLAELGYTPVAAATQPDYVCFRHETAPLQVAIWAAGAEEWFDTILVRDYLSAVVEARERYAAVPLAPLPAAELVTAARAWQVAQHGFAPLYAITDELQTLPARWCISSGWALDLFLGRVTRCHHDVDIVVARTDQLLLQAHLGDRGWKFVTPWADRLEPWPPHMRLESPRHQAHAHRAGAFIDCLLTDLADGVWRYRREPSIVHTTERIFHQTPAGLTFLAPEVVLLFKSKNSSHQTRTKDQTDFERVYPHLDGVQRAWLRWALLATAPHHPWLPLLI